MYKYLVLFILLLSHTFVSINAEAGNFAISPGRPTDYEMRSLPPYCKVKFKFGMNRKNPLVTYISHLEDRIFVNLITLKIN